VAQRTREIGLRIALGAAPSDVRRMVLRQVLWMTVIGAAVGLLAAIWVAAGAEQILFEMKGRDPLVFAGATVTLGLVALLAGLVPAHRAAKVDPMTALRWE
jgi:ABC-type antimicrobial peptide transport system permease subunit